MGLLVGLAGLGCNEGPGKGSEQAGVVTPSQVGEVEEAYSSVGIERVVPLRFVSIRETNDGLFNGCGASTPCSLATAAANLYGSVHWANTVFRPAGIQFSVRSIETYYEPDLADHGQTTEVPWTDVKATIRAIFPNCPDLPPGITNTTIHTPELWAGIMTTRYSVPSEIVVWVLPDGNGLGWWPADGRYLRFGSHDAAPPGLLAHELGHWFGLHHPNEFAQRDAVTLQTATVGDVWDMTFCPGTGGSSPHRFFTSYEDAQNYSCATGLAPIYRGAGGAGGGANCTYDAASFVTCQVAANDAPGTYKETYNSNHAQLKGVAFPAKSGLADYGSNIMTALGTRGANRLVDSQARFVRRTIHHEVTAAKMETLGERGHRTDVGLNTHRQPQGKLDLDMDGERDLVIWMPPTGTTGYGSFKARLSNGSFGVATEYTLAAPAPVLAQPVAMDFTGDGRTDLGWVVPNNGAGGENDDLVWSHCPTATTPASSTCVFWPPDQNHPVTFGRRGDVVLPGLDFNGDGIEDMAVFRPSDGTWTWLHGPYPFNTGGATRAFGSQRGYLPLPGLYDSDEKADIVWWNPTTATFSLSLSTQNWPTSPINRSFGSACQSASTGTASERAGCVPIQGMLSWANSWGGVAKPRLGLGTWDASFGTYQFNWTPTTGATTLSCAISFSNSQNGRVMPAGLFDFNQNSGSPVTYSSMTLLEWGQQSGDGYLHRRSVTGSGCSGTTTSVNLGSTPDHWATFSVPDMTGDGKADLVQFDGSLGSWYILKSETSFSTWISVGGFGNGFSTIL